DAATFFLNRDVHVACERLQTYLRPCRRPRVWIWAPTTRRRMGTAQKDTGEYLEVPLQPSAGTCVCAEPPPSCASWTRRDRTYTPSTGDRPGTAPRHASKALAGREWNRPSCPASSTGCSESPTAPPWRRCVSCGTAWESSPGRQPAPTSSVPCGSPAR